ncbi:MAG: tetratricopeptide repeat protein [Thalassotalea sp.]
MIIRLKQFAISVAAAGVIYTLPAVLNVPFANKAFAEQAEVTSQRASKKVPAMRNRVYSQLARAQKLADEGDKIAGFEVLDEVKDRIDQLNSYEQAMLWNFYGFMYYANDDLANAIDSFEQVIDEEAIPESLYLSTTYSLAQLAMQQQDYKKALSFLTQWQASNTKALTASQHIVFAQVYYQDKNFNETLNHVKQAVELAKLDDNIAKEQWLILQRAAYYELKQPENVTQVMELLVKHYEKPAYWLQLAAMYGEIGQEGKQLGAMETAWQAGYITKETDIVMLAQLYMFNQLPYKAADLLDDAIAKGIVVPDEKRLELMSQAFQLAKEDEKAIPVLAKAAEIAETGKYDAQLAQSYLNLEKWQLAIDAANKALKRGGLENAGNMYLVLGMSHFNLKKFDDSLMAFNHAQAVPATAKTAKQWTAYVSKEQGYQAQISQLEQ